MMNLTTAEIGVNMFSVFMSGDNSLSDSQLIDTFHTVSKVGGVVVVHNSENEEVVQEGERKMLEGDDLLEGVFDLVEGEGEMLEGEWEREEELIKT